MLVQLQPPQPVSAVAVLSARHLIAASNEYGFALIDTQRQSVLLQNTLVNQAGVFKYFIFFFYFPIFLLVFQFS